MSATTTTPSVVENKELGQQFYSLDPNELRFFQEQTGILDEEALKQHIFQVQADAWKVYPFNCIRAFGFTKLKISRLPGYEQLMKLGRERTGALFLDIGCCFGNDARKAVADGFPVENTITSDLYPEFWNLGHKLFRTTPEEFPAHFIPGDALDPIFLKSVPPFDTFPDTPRPDLSTLTSLTPLLGHVSAIHASAFFHLFSEAKQLDLARSLAGLLSPEPGSIMFGVHAGKPEKGFRTESGLTSRNDYMFCHSPSSWIELMDGDVFKKGTVKVEARLMEINRHDLDAAKDAHFYILIWSVTRL